jgi:hypothetical protein
MSEEQLEKVAEFTYGSWRDKTVKMLRAMRAVLPEGTLEAFERGWPLSWDKLGLDDKASFFHMAEDICGFVSSLEEET